jgi:thioredoxin-related protein
MKYRLIAALLALLLAVNLFASDKEISEPDATWLTDFKQALKNSKETKKLILIAFTGSDWCHACMRLTKEHLRTDSFKKFAMENFILLQADFPRSKKNRLSPRQIAHNEKLAEKYDPEGIVPFLVIVDQREEVVGKTTYQKWNSADFINHLKSLMRQKNN